MEKRRAEMQAIFRKLSEENRDRIIQAAKSMKAAGEGAESGRHRLLSDPCTMPEGRRCDPAGRKELTDSPGDKRADDPTSCPELPREN